MVEMLFLVYAPGLVYPDLPKTHAFMILDSLYTIFFSINYMYFSTMFLYVKVFEKALDEPKYSSMYAQLCLRLSEEAPNFDDPGKTGNSVSTTLKVITKKIVISVFTGRFLANIF